MSNVLPQQSVHAGCITDDDTVAVLGPLDVASTGYGFREQPSERMGGNLIVSSVGNERRETTELGQPVPRIKCA